MAKYNFGEKQTEWSSRNKCDVPVWQSPKYLDSKEKAIEIIESGKFGVKPSDFWILMNETKNGKMAYTGLIISHNGCLKINDALDGRFDPSCVSIDKQGFGDTLVYTYCNKEQGVYEVGEVSKANCKNDYPYAMAYKRLFDRVVLKLSKLAYAGIYSDSEADEFKDPRNENTSTDLPTDEHYCMCCGIDIKPVTKKDGSTMSVSEIVEFSHTRFGRTLCPTCQKLMVKNEK